MSSIEVREEYTAVVDHSEDSEEGTVGDVEVTDSEFSEEESRVSKRSASNAGYDIATLISRTAINLVLPFINGMMLGFGEIFAHELGFKWGFTGARVLPRNNRKNVRVNEK